MSTPSAHPPHPALQAYYDTTHQKAEFVDVLFAKTARNYDRINAVAFCGTGGWYRRAALRRAGLRPNMRMLDVACGTGAVAVAALPVIQAKSIVCCDQCAGMLAVASQKIPEARFVRTSAEQLPFPSESFDFLSMGYALRHVADLTQTFAEYWRVLTPGGRLLLLEITKPRSRFAARIARSYFGHLVPFVSRLATHDKESANLMRYFWETIDACVPPESIIAQLQAAGFQEAKRRTELGVFSEYTAVKPLT